MKVIIAGGRDYKPTIEDYARIRTLLTNSLCTEIVSGGCSGADAFGEEMAKILQIPCKRFEAKWDEHGRAAGPIRNRAMAQYADAVILFSGGAGTASMEKEALKAGIWIHKVTHETEGI